MPETSGSPVLSALNEYAPVEPSGNGTEADPYIIADANGLGGVWYRLTSHWLLTNDVDLTGIRWSSAIVPFFTGVFDGNGHSVCNADVNTPGGNSVALFGCLAMGGQIKDLAVENVSIRGRDFVGGIVGYNYEGIISGSYSTGSVNGVDFVGGLVGNNRDGGSLSNCHSNSSSSGASYVGGLVGQNYDGTISNCKSTGTVSGDENYVGGLVGGNLGTIMDSCSTVLVSGAYRVGGLVGDNDLGSVRNCYATGSVRGEDYIGGLIGYNYNDLNGIINDSYSTGSVEGDDYVGGLVGYNYDHTVSRCYSTGSVSGDDYVGGLVGKNYYGFVSWSFWDRNTSNCATSSGGTRKTTVEMKTENTFTSAGWDFVDIWAICEGTNYPRFVWQIPQADWICPDGVSFEDLDVLAGRWATTDCASQNDCDGTDMTGDGRVDFADYARFAQLWIEGQ
jgi:hypothetical protein